MGKILTTVMRKGQRLARMKTVYAWHENVNNMASYSCVYYAKHGLKCNTQVHEKK